SYLATQSARDSTQISLISQVAQAWLNYSFATANLRLAEQTLKAQLDSYNLNKKRFDVGIDSEVPLRQAQISVETARNDVANYKTQIAQAQNLLNLLVGQPVPQNLLPTQPVKRIAQQNVFTAGLPSDLLNNRPDVKAAEYNLSAAGANIGAAKARLFPTISLTGSAGYASTDLSDLFKSGGFVWSVGPSLDLPIFDWGTRRANVKISETDQKIALSDYEKSVQSAFREVNDALATRANIGERLTAQQRLVEATNRNYTLSNARFRAGIDSYLTVLDAQRSSYAAEQGLLLLQQANLNNQIELYKTLGGGLKANTSDTVVHQPSSAELKKQ
ncbi:multidrug efflux RND transporter outer membrane channel subunit AdeK, partial [Acinetobacter baumannii]